jgi:hypothetical protein
VQVPLRAWVRGARRGENHRIIAAPTGFDKPIRQHPHQLRPRPERFRHGDIVVSACLDVGWDVGGDVIAARQERRY